MTVYSVQKKSVQFPTSDAIVTSNGFVRWEVSTFIVTHCTLDVKFFPFDSQRCSINFGPSLISMTRDSAPVNFIYDEFVLQMTAGKDVIIQVSKLESLTSPSERSEWRR